MAREKSMNSIYVVMIQYEPDMDVFESTFWVQQKEEVKPKVIKYIKENGGYRDTDYFSFYVIKLLPGGDTEDIEIE